MMVMAAAQGLSQILDVGKLAVLGGAREVCGELVELVGCRRIAVGLSCLGGRSKVGGDLLCDLLILAGIALLELLERVHDIGEG